MNNNCAMTFRLRDGTRDKMPPRRPKASIRNFLVPALLLAAPAGAYANVITDWDEKAVAIVQGNVPAPPPLLGGTPGGTRIMAVMHIAMFEAVNADEQRYESYRLGTKPDPGCSQQAAAATAAATVLIKMLPDSAAKTQQELDAYLAGIPNGEAKDRGIKLGEETALKVIALRVNDGNDKVYAYRPRHPARRLCPDDADGELGTLHHAAIRADQSIAVPASAVRRLISRVSNGPRTTTRSKTLAGRTAPHGRHDSPRMHKFWLSGGPTMYSALPASGRDRQRHVGGRERPLHGGGDNGDDGRRYRHLRCEIHL